MAEIQTQAELESQKFDTEELVGTVEPQTPHADSIHSYNPFGSKYYCGPCKGNKQNKPVHCTYSNGQLNVSCSNVRCQCLCRTHWHCHYGSLHPHGGKCKCALKEINIKRYDPKAEKKFEKILLKAKKMTDAKIQESQIKYKDEGKK